MTLVVEEEEEGGREEKLEPKAEKLAKSDVPEGGGVVVLSVGGGAVDMKVALVLVVEGLLNPPIPNGSNEKSVGGAPPAEEPVEEGLITPSEEEREKRSEE